MSGIFKGDSIYKSGGGGGGGGYKDGGQLVDGDLIKVENNTISSYDNINRDTINFYFEPDEGEILNAVVELATAVNSTVKIFVLRNGFYYLLGNIGGNSVTSDNEYKVNITGDSYSIEQVTINNDTFEIVGGVLLQTKQILNLIWTVSDYRNNFYKRNEALNIIPGGDWRLPNDDDWKTLQNYSADIGYKLKTPDGWNDGGGGDNYYGFNGFPYGFKDGNNVKKYGDEVIYFSSTINGGVWSLPSLSKDTTALNIMGGSDYWVNNCAVRVRFCKNA